MNPYLSQIEGAVEAVEIHSPTTYSWFGKRSPQLPTLIRRSLTPSAARSYLVYNLQAQLYSDFYCPGGATMSRTEVAGLVVSGVSLFVEQLSAANTGKGYWAGGWEIRGLEEGRLVLHKTGLEIRARLEDCLVPEGASPTPGQAVSVGFPKEYMGISPGYYMALGDAWLTPEDSQELVRFYWHITADGAALLMKGLTHALNNAGLPFRLKVLSSPERYTRCDAGVLYIRKSDCLAVTAVLEDIYPDVSPYLRGTVPALTLRLAPGLGLAEDPGGGESFGLHRCALIAEGLMRAYEANLRERRARFEAVTAHLAETGIEPTQPFLRPGSVARYSFTPSNTGSLPTIVAHNGHSNNSHGDILETNLQTAAAIGRRITRQAIWYEDRCNWLGTEVAEGPSRGTYSTVYKSLGPDLYSGTAGIALFMAELYGSTGDEEARHTALGAMRQALSRADDVPPIVRLGLHSGWGGIAWAAARVGLLLHEPELLERAANLAVHWMSDIPARHEYDLLSGNAGAIIAALALRGSLERPNLLDFAVRMGDDLLAATQESAKGCSWPMLGVRMPRNLTGFSHGTAGIGLALLELWRATGDERYRGTAKEAFRYERHWFDPDKGNWADLREPVSRGRSGRRTMAFATLWCHGAPGIALSRLRAYDLDPDPTYLVEARTALQTTRQAVEALLHADAGNYSLCHGLAGNAEVLAYGSEALQSTWPVGWSTALDVARHGIERYGAVNGHRWPSGAGGGENPSLMLGLAGTGFFYLRLHDPSVPSVLLPAVEQCTPVGAGDSVPS